MAMEMTRKSWSEDGEDLSECLRKLKKKMNRKTEPIALEIGGKEKVLRGVIRVLLLSDPPSA